MRRHNIISRTLLVLTVITFALASPVLVQRKRRASVDVVHVPEDGITVLGKRVLDADLDLLWSSSMFRELRNMHIPDLPADVPPPNLAQVHEPEEAHVPPPDPADPDRESIELDNDAPPASPGSEHSHSSSTESENWYTAPSSPVSDSEVDRWSTISNAPSTESPSPSETLKEADDIIKGKAKVDAHSDSDSPSG